MSSPENARVHESAVTATLRLIEESQSHTPSLQDVADAMDMPLERLQSIFPDKTSLLISVVEQACMVLIDRCTRAVVQIDPDDPMQQCHALITAYLCWVVEYPSQFRLMSDQRLINANSYSQLRRYQDSINDLASRMMQRAQDKGQLHPKEDIASLVITSRCFVYGTARMIVDGRLGDFSQDSDPVKAAQVIVGDYIRRVARGSQGPVSAAG
ncbi:TetR-like C-terminal domain-containing protein [Paracoccus sp. R86501]|uniref:TetR-like C-terminal domain-containing protein n=1 Tax=Paracoccus sp. R86501 TaxID=3101711 RepID=UPI00366FD351